MRVMPCTTTLSRPYRITPHLGILSSFPVPQVNRLVRNDKAKSRARSSNRFRFCLLSLAASARLPYSCLWKMPSKQGAPALHFAWPHSGITTTIGPHDYTALWPTLFSPNLLEPNHGPSTSHSPASLLCKGPLQGIQGSQPSCDPVTRRSLLSKSWA